MLLPTIVGGALALATIASIDALLCSKLLARRGEPKVDGDRLLVRIGTANALCATHGGITGGLNIGPSRDNKAAGGRTPVSALVNAYAVLVTLLVLFPALSYLPCVALSAVIVVIAIQHFDPWTMRLARRVASRLAKPQGDVRSGAGRRGRHPRRRHRYRARGVRRRRGRRAALPRAHEPLKLTANLGRELSHRLRAANRTIQQLEE